MARLFFLLSGEHSTLPISELTAILESEGCSFTVLERLDQILRLESDLECVETITRRAALTRLCGLELLTCEADPQEIMNQLSTKNLDKALRSGESFAVRVKRVKDHSPTIIRVELERKIGQLLLENEKHVQVDLRKPDKTFIGVLTGKKFIFGLKLAEIIPKPFLERRPIKKPYFHPSAMQSKLARCMVNLAKPKSGELVFDPFCGTGSILIEAALIGCRVLGADIKRQMVKGTAQNMLHFQIDPEGLLVADSSNLPIRKVDFVVFDPPYGRSATTMKRTTTQVVKQVLISANSIIKKGGRICMAAPKTLEIKSIGKELGYKHLNSYFVYVHRSLTREVAVFEKV